MKKREREFGDYIQDIFDSIEAIEEFIKGMNFEDFEKDKKTVYAVVRSIEVIGEATKHIPAFIRKRYPSIPWKDMAGMRDKVIHEYFGVNLKVVWKAAKEELPPLKQLIRKILAEYE